MDIRSNDRDLAHYYYDFEVKAKFSQIKLAGRKLIKPGLSIFIVFLIWFAKESYHGLIIYD